MPLDINLLQEAEFNGMQEEWNRLLSESSSDNVFLRWEWIHTWWKMFSTDRQLFILSARHKSVLIGIAPFYIERAGPLGVNYLRLCSDELSPDYQDVIVQKGMEQEFRKDLFNYLAEQSGQWDMLTLDNLHSGAVLMDNESVLKSYSHTVEPFHRCPYIKIEGTFADYFKQQHQLERFSLKKKQMKAFNEKKITHRVVKDESTLTIGLSHLFQLHEKRANDTQLKTNFASLMVKQFHAEVSRLFLKQGILNLQLFYDGETPICAHYSFSYKNKTYFFQSGFDPAWGKLSISMVMMLMEIEQAFNEGQEEFDFLKGNESYKSLWANAVRDEKRLVVYNNSFKGSVMWAYHHVKPILRNVRKSLQTLLPAKLKPAALQPV